MRFSILITVIYLSLISCKESNEVYISSIENWKQERFQNLTAPISWSSLTGLVWLKEGNNYLGSDANNDVVFPLPAPSRIGSILKNNDSLLFKVEKDVVVTLDSRPIDFDLVKTDTDAKPSYYQMGQFQWTIIERADKIGIRIWDTLSVNRYAVQNLDYFPIDPKMKMKAVFSDSVKRTIKIKNAIGLEVDSKILGKLTFNIDGTEFSLEANDGGRDDFFLIFADLTTSEETYGGGRYLYCPKPDSNNVTFIDFNKSYTPPCGFTEWATCLLPTQQNKLNVEIKAGELYHGDH